MRVGYCFPRGVCDRLEGVGCALYIEAEWAKRRCKNSLTSWEAERALSVGAAVMEVFKWLHFFVYHMKYPGRSNWHEHILAHIYTSHGAARPEL